MRAPLTVGILAPVLAVVGAAAPARADRFSPRDLDKQAHLAVSYGLTLTGSVVLRRYQVKRWQAVAIAAAAALAIGAFKELALDDPGDWGDMLANGLGAGAAAAVVFSFRL